MAEGVLEFKNFLNSLGYSKIYAVFPHAIIDLDEKWWNEILNLPKIDTKICAKLYFDLSKALSEKMKVISCIEILGDKDYICKKEFVRVHNDTHMDYIKAQNLVFQHIKKYIPNLLEMRNPPHTELYPHFRYAIDEVEQNGKIRENTCR